VLEWQGEKGWIPLLLENLPNWKGVKGKVEDFGVSE